VALASGDARPEPVGEPEAPQEQSIDPPASDRLSELERKVDRLLRDKEERLSHAKILERLDALER
jgi:hypothetical protein